MMVRRKMSIPPRWPTSWASPPRQTLTLCRHSPTMARNSFGWLLPAKVSSPHILSAPTPPVGGLPSARPWFLVRPRFSSESIRIATNPAPNNPLPTLSPCPQTWAMVVWTSTRPSPRCAKPSINPELVEGCPLTAGGEFLRKCALCLYGSHAPFARAHSSTSHELPQRDRARLFVSSLRERAPKIKAPMSAQRAGSGSGRARCSCCCPESAISCPYKKRGMRETMRQKLSLIAILFLAATATAQTPPPLVSPEVHADRRVTFRFRGPNVKEVAVSLEGGAKPLRMP